MLIYPSSASSQFFAACCHYTNFESATDCRQSSFDLKSEEKEKIIISVLFTLPIPSCILKAINFFVWVSFCFIDFCFSAAGQILEN